MRPIPSELRTGAVEPRGRVLLLDFDPKARQMISDQLALNGGQNVDQARNVTEALALLRRTRYDVVLVACPGSETGCLDLCRMLRDRNVETSIILIWR